MASPIAVNGRPQILDACCGGRMWWWDKEHYGGSSVSSAREDFDVRERHLRQISERRMVGLVEIVKRRRETGDPDDLADAAFILGAVDDFSNYVSLLRGIE